METSRPVSERPRRPEWMKVRAPSADSSYFDVKKLIHGASLNTICEEAVSYTHLTLPTNREV